MNLYHLREESVARARLWRKDAQQIPSVEFHAMELAGEVGEACNAIKKYRRWQMNMVGGVVDMGAIADEIADVVICADLLASSLDINLAEAVANKFNKTSEKHGFPQRLAAAYP